MFFATMVLRRNSWPAELIPPPPTWVAMLLATVLLLTSQDTYEVHDASADAG